jgi:RNA polymerase primary sigma factor
VASTAQNPPLPREFEHAALQELLARGAAAGRVDAESFRSACEAAAVGDPKRLKAVLRAFATAGVEIGLPTATKVAAATSGGATKTQARAKAPTAKAATARAAGSTDASEPAEEGDEAAAASAAPKKAATRAPAKKAPAKKAAGTTTRSKAAAKAAPVADVEPQD